MGLSLLIISIKFVLSNRLQPFLKWFSRGIINDYYLS